MNTAQVLLAEKVYRTIKLENNIIISPQTPIYHGSPNKIVTPIFGGGETKHDYGAGFYLTQDIELAKEWAVCNTVNDGYLHKFILDTVDLSILDFNSTYGVLTWLATLSKHRSSATSKLTRRNEQLLINKYYDKEVESYDVIVGYRADDSFFSFAKQAIRGEVDISLLDEIMHKGDLGYQVFIQSEKAFKALKEIEYNSEGYYKLVSQAEYKIKYDNRDKLAREHVANLIESDRNTLTDTIEKYLDLR